MNLKLGREVTSNFNFAESREWLVTNGIGGYASGTVAGVLTRHYHGLLIAALKPPVARTLLLTKLDEVVEYNQQTYELYANRWAFGAVEAPVCLNLESFYLEGTTPVWNFAFADGLLEKRIWMQQGENTTYVRYSYRRGSQPVSLSLKTLVNYRDYHSSTHSDVGVKASIDQIGEKSLRIKVFADAASLYLSAYKNRNDDFIWETVNTWNQNFVLAVEQYRGLDDIEDHLHAVTGKVTLEPGDFIDIVASTESQPQLDSKNSLENKVNRERKLIDLWYAANSLSKTNTDKFSAAIEQLVLAAD